MCWSIENRVPFLTNDMAEFSLSLPKRYMLSHKGKPKSLFRAATRGIVADGIIDRRDKNGFQTPEQDWLPGQGARIQDWLSEAADELPFLNATAIRRHINEMIKLQKPFRSQPWRIINYYRWAQMR